VDEGTTSVLVAGKGRQHGLRGWFGKIKRRRWIILFVFEFFVVLLGVLAAQGLQSWFQSRQETKTAAAARATLNQNLRSIALSAEIRRRDLTCYGNRLRQFEQAIKSRTALTDELTAPAEALVIDLGWSGNVPALIAEHYGSQVADKYVNVALWVDAFRRAQEREQESWTDLSRLSTRLGPPSDDDWSAAKGAIIDANRDLLHISWATGHLAGHARDLRIEADLEELAGLRSAKDACRRAVSYSLEEHQRAQRAGRLITGEALLDPA
jgi:hypothetical protein